MLLLQQLPSFNLLPQARFELQVLGVQGLQQLLLCCRPDAVRLVDYAVDILVLHIRDTRRASAHVRQKGEMVCPQPYLLLQAEQLRPGARMLFMGSSTCVFQLCQG